MQLFLFWLIFLVELETLKNWRHCWKELRKAFLSFSSCQRIVMTKRRGHEFATNKTGAKSNSLFTLGVLYICTDDKVIYKVALLLFPERHLNFMNLWIRNLNALTVNAYHYFQMMLDKVVIYTWLMFNYLCMWLITPLTGLQLLVAFHFF